MPQYLPVSTEREQNLQDALAGTMFQNVENFIKFYNSGYINSKNPEIKEVLSEITATYKNIKEVGQEIKFIGTKEIYAEELADKLAMWSSITKMKRAVEELIESGELSANDIIAFKQGSMHKVVVEFDDEEEVDIRALNKISKESFYGSKQLGEEIAKNFSSKEQKEDGVYEFAVSDILNIDDSFIEEMYQLLP